MKIENKIILIIGVILVVFILFYVGYFRIYLKYSFSTKPEDWATFSTYGSMIISFATLIITTFLTFSIYKLNRDNSESQKIFQEAINKPILSLQNNGSGYSLQNIGNGAALNVKIHINIDPNNELLFWDKFKASYTYTNNKNDGIINNWKRLKDKPEIRKSHENFEKLTEKSVDKATEDMIKALGANKNKYDISLIGYSIKGNSNQIKLEHTYPAFKIRVDYKDIFGNKYLLYMENDEEHIEEFGKDEKNERGDICTLINYRSKIK